MRGLFGFFALLFIASCTSSHNVQFRLDERFFNAIPQYQYGKKYISSNLDTLTLTLTSSESTWPIAGYDPSEDRYYLLEKKIFHYSEKNNPGLTFYFELLTYPDLELYKPAGTELTCVLPNGVFRLAFLSTDTVAEAPSIYIGNYTVQGKTYEYVYSNPALYYYSAAGELLAFKLNNSIWYEALPE